MTLGEKLPVWLDCDTGNDDTFAILLASLHPSFNLVGISTVYGNAPLEHTTHNTLAILEVLGFQQDQIKVYPGELLPLTKVPQFAALVHGESGLTGVQFPSKLALVPTTSESYTEALRSAILHHRGALNVVCTGALTNFAMFIQKHPELRAMINFVSIMGGGIGVGNVTPYAEFNVHCDPEAAAIVLEDRELRKLLVPLNLTHQALATKQVMAVVYDSIAHRASMARMVFNRIMLTFAAFYSTRSGFESGPPVHDPMAVFALFALLEGEGYGLRYERGEVAVVTNAVDVYEGQTVLTPAADGSTYVGLEINIEQFWGFIFEALRQADKHVSDHPMSVTFL